jgi:hypothetical protein
MLQYRSSNRIFVARGAIERLQAAGKIVLCRGDPGNADHPAGNKQKSCQTLTISEQGVFRVSASLLRMARHG